MTDQIKNFLSQKQTGALHITGEWGCGKTYYIKNTLIPKLEEEKKYFPLYISVFGKNNIVDIKREIFNSTFTHKMKRKTFKAYTKKGLKKVGKGFSRLISNLEVMGCSINIDNIITVGQNYLADLPKDSVVIIDDCERLSTEIQTNDFWGVLSEIFDKNLNIIVVSNGDIKGKETDYSEKVIAKTLAFTPDINSVYDGLINDHQNEGFLEFMKQESVKSVFTVYRENYKYKDDFKNIRSLIFAITNFYEIYRGLIPILKGEQEKIVQSKLLNLWIFVYSVTHEIRNNRINEGDYKEYKRITKFQAPTKEKSDSFQEEILKRLRNNFYSTQKFFPPFVFYFDIFEFLRNNTQIDYLKLNDELSIQFVDVDKSLRPTSQFRRFKGNMFSISQEDFEKEKGELLANIEQGKFTHYPDYFIIYEWLTDSDILELFSLNEGNLDDKFKTGLGIHLENTNYDFLNPNFRIYFQQFSDDKFQFLKQTTEIIFKEKVHEFNSKVIKQAKEYLETDLSQFLIYYGRDENDYNILRQEYIFYPRSITANKTESLEPYDIEFLGTLFRRRYDNTSLVFEQEKPFIIEFIHDLAITTYEDKRKEYCKNKFLIPALDAILIPHNQAELN